MATKVFDNLTALSAGLFRWWCTRTEQRLPLQRWPWL